MSASSSAPAEIGNPEDGIPVKAKLKPIPSWKWSLVRSNASPVVLSHHEEFDWKSFSCQSSSTGIDALPLEVFEMIVKHLQLCHLKSLRLVNKAHLLRLTPQVFRHVTVHLHPKSFEGLHSIAAHSHLRQLVRSLTYDIRMVPQFKDEKIWQSVKERFVDPVYNAEGATFANYEEYYAAQILAAKADRQNLEQAFKDLDNLSSLELSTGPTVIGADWQYPRFTKFDLEKFGGLLSRLGTVPCALSSKKHQDRFLSLLLASEVLGDRFESLTLDKLEWTAERLLGKLSQKLDKLQPLKHLKHLKLGMNVLVGRKIYQNYYMYSTARKPYCVASIGDLDSLELCLHYTERQSVWGPFEDAIVPYSELGRDHIWQTYVETYWSAGPKIRRLTLTNVATTPTQLQVALEGSKSLEYLNLENIRLTNGSWVDIFEEMANVWQLSIIDIGLKGEFSSWWESWQSCAATGDFDHCYVPSETPQDLVNETSTTDSKLEPISGSNGLNATIGSITHDFYEQLLKLPEPERLSCWLKHCFEESSTDEVGKIAVWKAYKGYCNDINPMPVFDFMRVISETFSATKALVVNEDSSTIKGIRLRRFLVSGRPIELLLVQLQRWIVGHGLEESPFATPNVAKYLGDRGFVKCLWDQFGSDPGFITACVADSDDRRALGDCTFRFSPGKLPISENDSWRRTG